MSQTGNLSKVGFAKLLTYFTSQKQSGTLRLTRNKKSKFILFENGQITSSYSEYPEDTFQAVIQRMQILPESQQAELAKEAQVEDGEFAKRLIEKGYVTEREFLEILKRQNQDIILSLFEWGKGDFVFYQNKFPKVKTISLKIPFKWILEKGMERAQHRKKIDKELPENAVIRIIDEDFRITQSTENPHMLIRRLFDCLSEPRSVREIVLETGLTEFEAVSLVHRYLKLEKLEAIKEKDEDVSTNMRGELAEAEILFSKQKYWEAWNKMRRIIQQQPGNTDLNNTYKIYAEKFKEELGQTIPSPDLVPQVLKSIDDEIYSKFPSESSIGFLLSRIDGRSSIRQLCQVLGINMEKLYLTLYLLVKSGTVELMERKDPTPEEISKRRQYVRSIWENMQKQNFYEILGCEVHAATADIKSEYFKMAKQFHPDARSDDDPDDIKEKLDAIFVKMRDAYHTLSDKDQRKKYDRKLQIQEDSENIDLIKSRTKAQLQFAVGMKNLESREYRRAMEYLRSAIDLDPYEGRYYGKLAEVCIRNPKWYRAGILACKKAIDLEPDDLTFLSTLGILYKLEGNLVEAEKQFRLVLQTEPGNHTARQELKSMGKDVPPAPPRKETKFTPMARKKDKS